MSNLNSYNFQEIYKELGIETKKLFCTMLNVEMGQYCKDEFPKIFSEECLYYSPNFPWVKGLVALDNPHITLLYGTLERVTAKHITAVLDGWEPEPIQVEEYSYFESPTEEEYYTIIAKIRKTDNLMEGHQRLSLMPHINTFLEYKPHLTIAYIKKFENVDDYTALLNSINTYFAPHAQEADSQLYKDPVGADIINKAIVYDNNTNEQLIRKLETAFCPPLSQGIHQYHQEFQYLDF